MAVTTTATATSTTTITTTFTTTSTATTTTVLLPWNLTVLYGEQVVQTIVYYTYIGLVFNNYGTVAHHDQGETNLLGRHAPKVWAQDFRVLSIITKTAGWTSKYILLIN